MHVSNATLCSRGTDCISSTVQNYLTRSDPKTMKNLDRVAFSDDDHSELSCDLCGNLHFASTKPPLLTTPSKTPGKRTISKRRLSVFWGVRCSLQSGLESRKCCKKRKIADMRGFPTENRAVYVSELYRRMHVLIDCMYSSNSVPRFRTWWASSSG